VSSTTIATDQFSNVDYATVLALAAHKRGMDYSIHDKPMDIASKLRIKGYEYARRQANVPVLQSRNKLVLTEIDAYIKLYDQERAQRAAYVQALSAGICASPDPTSVVKSEDSEVFRYLETVRPRKNCKPDISTDAPSDIELDDGYTSGIDSNHKGDPVSSSSRNIGNVTDDAIETISKSIKVSKKSIATETKLYIGSDEEEGYIESVSEQHDDMLSSLNSVLDTAFGVIETPSEVCTDALDAFGVDLEISDALRKSPRLNIADDDALRKANPLRNGGDEFDGREFPDQILLPNRKIEGSDEDAVLKEYDALNQPTNDANGVLLSIPEISSRNSNDHTTGVDAQDQNTAPSRLNNMQETDKAPSLSYTLALLAFEDLEAHQRLAVLSNEECMARLNAFLEQNSMLLESYKIHFSTDVGSDGVIMNHPVLGLTWYTMRNRVEICGAIKWLDALLHRFQNDIFTEDRVVLLPKLREMEKQRGKLEKADEDERKKRTLRLEMKEEQRRKEFDGASEKKWKSFHEQWEAIKDSNTMRTKLLTATKFDSSLFHEIAFSASLIAVNDPHIEIEELSIEVLQIVLSRVLNTIRLNEYYLLKGPEKEPIVHRDMETIGLEYRDALQNWSSDDLQKLDALTPQHGENLSQMSRLQGSHYPSTSIFEFEDDDRAYDFFDQEMKKNDWATNFPPHCWRYLPRGQTVRLAVDKKYIAQKDEWLTNRDNMKPLSELTENEVEIWIKGKLSHVSSLRKVIEEATDEFKKVASIPEYLQDDSSMHNIKDLKKKQVWFRDQAIMILRKMRKDCKTWQDPPFGGASGTDADDIADLECDIDDYEKDLMGIQPAVPVTFPWITGLCPKVNRPDGCKALQNGVCPLSHDHAGRACKAFSKGRKCPHGDNCSYKHWLEGDGIGNSPETPTSARSFADATLLAEASLKSARPCPFINKPGGCSDKVKYLYNHRNYGIICQKFLEGVCTWNGRCAFVHPNYVNAKPLVSLYSDPRRELLPVLDQVLQDPKSFKVCRFVNRGIGCFKLKFQGHCDHNHSLAGIACPDDNGSGFCSRGGMCPLKHGVKDSTARQVRPDKRQAEEPPTQEFTAYPKRPRLSDAFDDI
jgi:hypothetical protein